MSQEIDLQAQQEGESDKAYLAYITYRDLGRGRTEQGAYEAYLDRASSRQRKPGEKRGKASAPFRSWRVQFGWDKRTRDWDNKKMQRFQSKQLEAGCQEYIKKVEDARELLEKTAVMGMKSAELSLAIGYEQLQKMAKESKKALLPKTELDRLAVITRTNKDSIDTLAAAKAELYDALGLVQIVEHIGDGKN